MKPQVEITYCTGCNWMLRASWMAQEVLYTFGADLAGVLLKPDDTGGVFRITVDGVVVWDRRADCGFPDAKELKTRIRDLIAPEKDLGHLDRIDT